MNRSWKTTLGGALSAFGLAVVAIDPSWSKYGLLLAAFGQFFSGLFGRDNNVTSEQVKANKDGGAGPTVATLVGAGLLGAALMGCGTLPPGETENARVQREVAGWSEDIVSLILVAEPKYRPAIEQAVAALDGPLNSGKAIDFSAITSALGRLEALQSKDAKLALIGGRMFMRRTLGNVELQTPEMIHSAGLGLRDGLKAALGQ